jgi:hypothetical protein
VWCGIVIVAQAARRPDAGQFVEIEIGDRLQCLAGGTVAQRLGQRSIFGLEAGECGNNGSAIAAVGWRGGSGAAPTPCGCRRDLPRRLPSANWSHAEQAPSTPNRSDPGFGPPYEIRYLGVKLSRVAAECFELRRGADLPR